ncbi:MULTISPECIES: hypothetical protein [unclassified Sphingobacterium]|uniref:hypothetical protein n=1 Tax=unclassified Sphingobacterium TaxID=2609468 RepID=UPI0025E71929|nr:MULTISPECIES: hypothetical protein [unclassified Sphingobacterium]
MKETIEFRINYDYAHLLFKADEGKNLGTSVRVVELSKEDPRYSQIPIIDKEVKKKYDRGFFYSWQIKRKYSKKELDTAKLLHLKIKVAFEPTGEECGTLYDETAACEICGANRKQASPLILKKGTIPKRDIARTIGGEVVVSEKFVNAVRQRSLKGLQLSPINVEKYYQLTADTEIELSPNTITGDNPFETSTGSNGGIFNISGYDIVFEKEVYVCPKGDLIGLNLLSEPYVTDSPLIKEFDFFASRQKIGVKRGLLRPEPIYFCSPAFRQMVEEEKLSGFEFEIANIE